MIKIQYQGHFAGIGWLPNVVDGQIAGTVGGNRALEAFRITGLNVENLGIHGFAHVQDMGWSSGNILTEDIGTTGLGKHIEAIKIGLIGPEAVNYDIWYRCHVQDYGWFNWSKNGEVNGTEGGNRQVEAIQIELHAKNEGFSPRVDTDMEYINLTPQNPVQPQTMSIVDIARSYLGYVSGTSQDSAFGRRIAGANAGDWCCYFAVCCAIDAGLNVPVTGYVPTMLDWARQTGRFTGNPQPGFFVLYDFNGNGTPDHIGIVEEVRASDWVVAIEGNTDQGNGTGVYRVERNYSILGYVNPF